MNSVIHLIITRWDGQVVEKEAISKDEYSTFSNFNRAVQNRVTKLSDKYPEEKFRVDMVSSASTSPIALDGSV